MPYNTVIDERIRAVVGEWRETSSKKMFGGVCHLLRGNMLCGVYRDFMILRLGEEGAAAALRGMHVRVFDITGRPMKGWVMVEEKGFRTEKSLREWLEQARAFVRTLPPK